MMNLIIIVIGILPPYMEIYKAFRPYLGINFRTLRLAEWVDSALFFGFDHEIHGFSAEVMMKRWIAFERTRLARERKIVRASSIEASINRQRKNAKASTCCHSPHSEEDAGGNQWGQSANRCCRLKSVETDISNILFGLEQALTVPARGILEFKRGSPDPI